MSYSTELKINVNKLNADEALLVLVSISHSQLTVPVKLVNDNKDFMFNNELYSAMPFEIKRQNDIKGELPKITFVVPNVGRGMVRWIDASGGGRDAEFSVILARRSAPNIIEEKLDLGLESVDINTQTVTFNLVVQNNLIKRAMRFTYDTKRAQGLF